MGKRPSEERTIQFKVLLSESEKARLLEVAKNVGLTPSDVVRQWIRTSGPKK